MQPLASYILFGIALVAASAVYNSAAAQTPEPANPVPPPASQSGQQPTPRPEKLHTLLLPTIQYAFNDFWYRSPPSFPPAFTNVSSAYVGQHVAVLPLVGHYKVGENGDIDVTYDLEFLRPDGKVDASLKDLIAFKGKKAHVLGPLFPQQSVGVFTDKEDPRGTYTLRVTIKDHIAGETSIAEKTLTINAYSVPELPADLDTNAWINQYYREPNPGLALPALYDIMKNTPQEKINTITSPILGFYNRLLTDNTWLLPFFAERLQEALERSQDGKAISSGDVMLGILLSYHLRNVTERPANLSERIWRETEQNRNYDWSMAEPATGGKITLPEQLDALWGDFLASGSYAPVRRIVSATVPVKITVDQLPATMKNLNESQLETLSTITPKAATWSLTSNARQHRLVHAYLTGMIDLKEDLTAQEEKNVRAILASLNQEIASKETASNTNAHKPAAAKSEQ